MAERKQTPDVLAEILGASTPAPDAPPAAAGNLSAAPARPAKSPKPRPTAAGPAWEYQVTSLQNARGWRPRFVDGQEVPGWMNGPLIHDYVNQRGEEGWELVAVTSGERLYGASDLYQLFFRRARK